MRPAALTTSTPVATARAAAMAAGALLFAVAWCVATAAPAAAQLLSGPGATDAASRVTAVEPAVAGLSARVVDTEGRIELDDPSGETIVVLADDATPYLRIDAGGAWVNAAARAAGGAGGQPEWRPRAGGRRIQWSDRRATLTGSLVAHVEKPWAIPILEGEQHEPGSIMGVVSTAAPPSPWGWVALAAALGLAAGAGGMTRRGALALPVLAILLVAADATHEVGAAWPLALDAPGRAGVLAAGGYFCVGGWVAALGSAVALVRGRRGALSVLGVSALVLGVIGGVGDLGYLARTQLPTALPPVTARLGVASTLGLGFGIFAAVLASHGFGDRGTGGLAGRRPALATAGPVGALTAAREDLAVAEAVRHVGTDTVLRLVFDDMAARRLTAGDRDGPPVRFEIVDGATVSTWTLGGLGDDAVQVRGDLVPFLRAVAGSVPAGEALTGPPAIDAIVAAWLAEPSASDAP